jgi:hypothetical protein
MFNIFPDQTEYFYDRFSDHFPEILANKKFFFSIWKNLELPEALTELSTLCERYDVVFFHTIEPLQMSRIIVANQVLENFKYRDKIVFVCSDQSHKLLPEYHEWCAQHNFTPLQIFQYNFISSYPSKSYMDEKDILHSIAKTKSRHYISLNATFRWHRLKLVADLYAEKLNHQGYISVAPGDRVGAWHQGSEEFKTVCPDDLAVSDWYSQEKDNFPYRLDDFQEDPSVKFDTSKGLLPFVQDSCFAITTDTWFGSNAQRADNLTDYKIDTWQESGHLFKTNCFPSTVYATEKCFKNFSSGLPFVVLAKPYTVQRLTAMGFDMYGDWIDHSYDTVEDNQIRYNMLLDEIRRLCAIPLAEWQVMLTDMTDTIIANYRRWQYTSNPANYSPISPPELLREYVDNAQ